MTSVLAAAKRAAYAVSSTAIVKATLVEGTLRGGPAFRCLLVHNCTYTGLLRERSFEAGARTRRQGHILIPALPSLLRWRAKEFDLCVAVLPRYYDPVFDGLADLKGREEVRQVIETTGGWEAMRRHFARKKRQITNNFAEKHGLSYRLTSEPADFDFFYHRMHRPLIERRYGALSDIDTYEEMKAFFRKGLLLFVLRDGQPVAGALSLLEGDTLVFRRSGVLDGDESHVRGGAQTALYYFQLQYAIDHGIRAVDAMKSAPFLNDGVFRHKAEWGAVTLPDLEARRSVFFFARGPREGLAHFFALNPTVVDHDGRLRGVVGIPGACDGAAPAPDALVRQLHTRGLHDLLVYGPDAVRTVLLGGTSPAPDGDVPQ